MKVTIEGEDIVIHGAGVQEVRLRPGTYQLHATKDGVPVKLSSELVTITRGGKEVVRVSLEPQAVPPPRLSHPLVPLLTLHEEKQLTTIALSPNGKTLASGHIDGRVILWDLTTGKRKAILEGHKLPAVSLAFAPDGGSLLTGAGDWRKPATPGEVKVWQSATGQKIADLKWSTGPVGSVAYSPDGKTLAAGGFTGAIRLWKAARTARPGARARTAATSGPTWTWSAPARLTSAGRRRPPTSSGARKPDNLTPTSNSL